MGNHTLPESSNEDRGVLGFPKERTPRDTGYLGSSSRAVSSLSRRSQVSRDHHLHLLWAQRDWEKLDK